jgi:hypothetical protein
VLALLLLTTTTEAQDQICDFEQQCYHGDPAHPDRVTPPPAPQYDAAPRLAPDQPSSPVCHLATIREAPMLPARIVEICTIPPAQEQAIRNRIRQSVIPDQFAGPPWSRP